MPKAATASPEEIVAAAKQYACTSIAYTYTEPTIFFEYDYDIARLAHKEGICNTFITNGHITEEVICAIPSCGATIVGIL